MSPTEAQMIYFYAGVATGFLMMLALALFISWSEQGKANIYPAWRGGYQPTKGCIDRSNPPRARTGVATK